MIWKHFFTLFAVFVTAVICQNAEWSSNVHVTSNGTGNVCNETLECKNGGSQDTTNCDRCFCPSGFNGTLCSETDLHAHCDSLIPGEEQLNSFHASYIFASCWVRPWTPAEKWDDNANLPPIYANSPTAKAHFPYLPTETYVERFAYLLLQKWNITTEWIENQVENYNKEHQTTYDSSIWSNYVALHDVNGTWEWDLNDNQVHDHPEIPWRRGHSPQHDNHTMMSPECACFVMDKDGYGIQPCKCKNDGNLVWAVIQIEDPKTCKNNIECHNEGWREPDDCEHCVCTINFGGKLCHKRKSWAEIHESSFLYWFIPALSGILLILLIALIVAAITIQKRRNNYYNHNG